MKKMNIATQMLMDFRLNLISQIQRIEIRINDEEDEELFAAMNSLKRKLKGDLYDVEFAIGAIHEKEYKTNLN
jgi:hypothetical protein